MFRVAVALSALAVLVAALALISCLSVEDRRTIRSMPRFAWVLVILLVPLAGPALWFGYGRPLRTGGGTVWRLTGLPEAPRPRAPDDDPEFLRSLDIPAREPSEDDQFRRWEEELRRREDERRRRRDPGADG